MTAKTCAQCGCGHEDPSGSLPHADGNPYPQYTPEHRIWAIATRHGKAAAAAEGYQNAPDLAGDYGENQLLADADWVPHDGTALRDELVGQYRNNATAAFHEEAERRQELADSLNDEMDFDHPVTVGPDGTVRDADRGIYAPELIMFTDEDGQAEPGSDEELQRQARASGWELLTGWTGQHAYRGPVMHPSEFVGGRLAEHIIATPGTYVVTAVETDDGDDEPAGWAIAYRE